MNTLRVTLSNVVNSDPRRGRSSSASRRVAEVPATNRVSGFRPRVRTAGAIEIFALFPRGVGCQACPASLEARPNEASVPSARLVWRRFKPARKAISTFRSVQEPRASRQAASGAVSEMGLSIAA